MRWVRDCATRRSRRPGRASSRSPAARTSASRRSPTRSSAPRSRSSPTSRRRRAARSAASRPAPTGSSCSSTCPASSARATRSPSGCSAGSSASSRTPTAACSSSTPSRASARATGSSPGCWRPRPVPVVIAVNKSTAPTGRRRPRRSRRRPTSRCAEEIFPVSARTGAGVPALVEQLVSLLPAGPVLLRAPAALRPAGTVLLAELVREQVLRARARRCRTRSRSRSSRSTTPASDLVRIEARDPGRDRVAEGDPDRRRRPDDQGDRDRRAPRDRARARRRRCTSSCRCACAATGAATSDCSTGWGSSERRPLCASPSSTSWSVCDAFGAPRRVAARPPPLRDRGIRDQRGTPRIAPASA